MEGLQETVRFELKDYREVSGCFDRIVSVGMFERVHTIGCSGPPTATHPFIAKCIFPGGYIPALSEIVHPIECSNLIMADLEILRLHYAKTLRAWRERVPRELGQGCRRSRRKFCRMWEFYLACSEVAFRYLGLVVLQVQVVKQIDVLPLTRDYMTDAEQRLPEQDVLNARMRLVGGNSG